MNGDHPLENRLRSAVELAPAAVMTLCAAACVAAPQLFFLPPPIALGAAAGFSTLALWRAWQGAQVLRYRGHLRRMPRYVLRPEAIPVSDRRLFLGRGFTWGPEHTQRVFEARDPKTRARFLTPSRLYRSARALENAAEHRPLLRPLTRALGWDHPLNPLRPHPPVGEDSVLHGVGADHEQNEFMDLGERVGHTLVLGTTRVGKTRVLELLAAADIRRGDVTIVFDPKGDEALLRRMYAEAKRAGRLDEFTIFNLGHPDISARYNPIGSFSRITEVAGRIAGQLPDQGNSAAFREFAWRFSNSVARALVALGRKPDFTSIQRYVTNIEALFIEYTEHWLARHGPAGWQQTVQRIEGGVNGNKTLQMTYKGRGYHAIALAETLLQYNIYDPVVDSLRGAFTYDRTYFDKITASLLPLLEKLTTGRVGQLLSPDYSDLADTRPVIDWLKIIRRGGIVYVGLDAMSDPEVAAAVGSAMFADLTSVAGQIYKFGVDYGLPKAPSGAPDPLPRLAIHADEFNQLVGDEFVPMVNKAGGAGYQVTVYTQTISDIEAKFGSRAKAGQVIGNLNTLIVLRVQNIETARILTDRLQKVRARYKMTDSGTSDRNDPGSSSQFTSQTKDIIKEVEIEMVSPADLVNLPKGQAFALISGQRLRKLRFPLIDASNDPCFPGSLAAMAAELAARRSYDDESAV